MVIIADFCKLTKLTRKSDEMDAFLSTGESKYHMRVAPQKHRKHHRKKDRSGSGERSMRAEELRSTGVSSSRSLSTLSRPGHAYAAEAASSNASSIAPPDSFDAALRAELAEAKALALSSEAVRHGADMLALRSEVARADALIVCCEDALLRQHDFLTATRAQLVEADHFIGELREEKLRAEQAGAELKLVLKQQLAKQDAIEAQLDRTLAQMGEQGELFRQSAATIAAHRDAEARAFGERRRIWEKTIDEWLRAGFSKRIDPLLMNTNLPVYTRLGELLVEEQAQREHQMEYLKISQVHEVETLRAHFKQRLAEADAQYAELRQQTHDFDEALGVALTNYLKGELAAKTSKVMALEREVRLLQSELRDTRERHDHREAERQRHMESALAPLLEDVRRLEHGVSTMADERKQLAGSDPRVLIDRKQKLLDEAQAEAAKERSERERVEALLRAERTAHSSAKAALEKMRLETAAKSMEFGEKEYYQVALSRLEEQQQVKEAEIKELVSMHSAKLAACEAEMAEARDELAELRRQRKMMALSLAEYATLEAQWVETKEAASIEMSRLRHESKALKHKAAKVPGLEAKLADSSYDEVVKLRTENSQLRARMTLLEKERDQSLAHVAKLQETIGELEQSKQAQIWLSSETQAAHLETLMKQVQRLKDGLGHRIVLQWARSTVFHCWKAWHLYVVRRQDRRQLGYSQLSSRDDEKPGALRASGQAAPGLPSALAPLADIATVQARQLGNTMTKLANFF